MKDLIIINHLISLAIMATADDVMPEDIEAIGFLYKIRKEIIDKEGTVNVRENTLEENDQSKLYG